MKPLPLPLYCVVLMLIILFTLSTPVAGKHSTATPGTLPLYTDTLTGWQIWKGFDGPTRVKQYETLVQVAEQLGQAVPQGMVNVNEQFLYENNPAAWYVFSLIIPDDVVTFWNAASELQFQYVSDKDTFIVTSTMLFFCSDTRRRLFFTYELNGEFPVPNVLPLYKGNSPILVYARFYMKNPPSYLLSCTPSRVRSALRR